MFDFAWVRAYMCVCVCVCVCVCMGGLLACELVFVFVSAWVILFESARGVFVVYFFILLFVSVCVFSSVSSF